MWAMCHHACAGETSQHLARSCTVLKRAASASMTSNRRDSGRPMPAASFTASSACGSLASSEMRRYCVALDTTAITPDF